jgi:hypothetical protein
MEESTKKYFVIDEATGKRVSSKAMPIGEAEKLIERTITESTSKEKPKLALKQYLVG